MGRIGGMSTISDIVRRRADSRMVSILPQGGESGRAAMLNRPVSGAVTLALCMSLAACGIPWPWRHRAPAAPQPVQELSIEGGAPIAQFWDRNTLLLDLT